MHKDVRTTHKFLLQLKLLPFLQFSFWSRIAHFELDSPGCSTAFAQNLPCGLESLQA